MMKILKNKKYDIYQQYQIPRSLTPKHHINISYGIIAIRQHIGIIPYVTGMIKRLDSLSTCHFCLSIYTSNCCHSTLNRNTILMIQRKNSNAYVDIVRGNYTSLLLLPYLISELTCQEKRDITTLPFVDLWKVLGESKSVSVYRYSLNKFVENKKSIVDHILLDKNHHMYTEIGFPKGRKEKSESPFECALREFKEETCIDSCHLEFLNNPDSNSAITETFLGSDNQLYRHIYFIAKVKPDCCSSVINLDHFYPNDEVSNLGWFTYEQAMRNIRSYDKTKFQVLQQTKTIFSKFHINL